MTPASVLSLSKEFHRGFELCYGNGLTANNDVRNAIVSGIVCLAFSIELGFKAILVGRDSSSDGHNYTQLFAKLPDEIKTEIERLTVGDDSSFENQLETVSNAFIERRYIFEKPGNHKIDIEFLIKLHAAVTQIGERYVSEQRAKLLVNKV